MKPKMIIGFEKIEFQGEKGLVKGRKVHYGEENPKFEGMKTDNKYINESVFENSEPIAIGDTVKFTYNAFGKVVKIERVH